MADDAILEIGLHPYQGKGVYRVEPRLWLPDQELRPPASAPSLACFDLDALAAEASDGDGYGQLLTESLFEPKEVKELFVKARAVQAQSGGSGVLRLRVYVAPEATELHDLRWETLRDPEDPDKLLALDENVLFSRYLSSSTVRPVRWRARANLRALVVIANPSDLDPGMAPVDVRGELERARQGLGAIPVDAICRCENGECDDLQVNIAGKPTLAELLERLRAGYDILYLVAHGKLHKGVPLLWLENPDGKAHIVEPGGPDGLVSQLEQWPYSIRLPQLVVLASCQSSGPGGEWASKDGGALAALGPRLAEAAVPAVVAMQGDVTMETVKVFMPQFFKELLKESRDWGGRRIDSAVAIARRAVRDRDDWWMPVLFTRLTSGRLWYMPGLELDTMDRWEALKNNIRQGRCTAIVGPGAAEWLLGSRLDIAQGLARQHHIPLASHKRESLPQVAQYLSVAQSPTFARDMVQDYASQGIKSRYQGHLETDLAELDLDPLISAVGQWQRRQDPAEPHQLLANLPIPVYITSGFSSLLFDALQENRMTGRDAVKKPKMEVLAWRPSTATQVFDDDPSYVPDPEQPLVYHLFGHLKDRRSVVLTEDDYFDWLIATASGQVVIPPIVEFALTARPLLFLGFDLDDWDLRVLLRLRRQLLQGAARADDDDMAHVAVQMDPSVEENLKPNAARKYLTDYFQLHGKRFNVYWGSTGDFLEELARRLQEED